jgi:hypothetical protein
MTHVVWHLPFPTRIRPWRTKPSLSTMFSRQWPRLKAYTDRWLHVHTDKSYVYTDSTLHVHTYRPCMHVGWLDVPSMLRALRLIRAYVVMPLVTAFWNYFSQLLKIFEHRDNPKVTKHSIWNVHLHVPLFNIAYETFICTCHCSLPPNSTIDCSNCTFFLNSRNQLLKMLNCTHVLNRTFQIDAFWNGSTDCSNSYLSKSFNWLHKLLLFHIECLNIQVACIHG